jgi:hypothetical protein
VAYNELVVINTDPYDRDVGTAIAFSVVKCAFGPVAIRVRTDSGIVIANSFTLLLLVSGTSATSSAETTIWLGVVTPLRETCLRNRCRFTWTRYLLTLSTSTSSGTFTSTTQPFSERTPCLLLGAVYR